jgi:hypothetical protein
MIRLINFKSQRQAEEWKDLKLDSRLRLITYSLAGFVFDRFQKVLVVTCILRTEEERREIYKDDPVLRDTVGVHEVWRAIDFRTVGFTPDEIGEMVKFLDDNFVYTGNHSTALAHTVIGFHLHIQVDGDGVTEIKGKPVEVLAVA